jgi:hypothetical protein
MDEYRLTQTYNIWCTGLGGGYQAVLACCSGTPTYGATIVRQHADEPHRSALGATIAIYEYFVLSALSCAMCLPLWPAVLSSFTMPPELIAARAARVMEQAQLVPAHRRPSHPAWKAAIRFFLRSTLLLSTLIISRLLYSTQLYSALNLLLLYCALLYSSN